MRDIKELVQECNLYHIRMSSWDEEEYGKKPHVIAYLLDSWLNAVPPDLIVELTEETSLATGTVGPGGKIEWKTVRLERGIDLIPVAARPSAKAKASVSQTLIRLAPMDAKSWDFVEIPIKKVDMFPDLEKYLLSNMTFSADSIRREKLDGVVNVGIGENPMYVMQGFSTIEAVCNHCLKESERLIQEAREIERQQEAEKAMENPDWGSF